MRLVASNWRWMTLDHSCSLGAQRRGAPIKWAMTSEGNGLAMAAMNSHSSPGATASSSSARYSRIAGR